jgi:hypothetical protein
MQFIPEEVSNVLNQKAVQFKVHALLHQAWSNGKYMAQIFLSEKHEFSSGFCRVAQ